MEIGHGDRDGDGVGDGDGDGDGATCYSAGVRQSLALRRLLLYEALLWPYSTADYYAQRLRRTHLVPLRYFRHEHYSLLQYWMCLHDCNVTNCIHMSIHE